MTGGGFATFDTPIGVCGIAWTGRGIAAVQLPEASDAETRARLQRRVPGARETPPPLDVADVIGDLTALLRGETRHFADVTLDLDRVPAFHRRVYDVARTIPCGATITYGDIAARLGDPGAARAVGQALGRNPFVLIVPCHRVLAASGRSGGFSAHGGVATKRRLLDIESGRPAFANW